LYSALPAGRFARAFWCVKIVWCDNTTSWAFVPALRLTLSDRLIEARRARDDRSITDRQIPELESSVGTGRAGCASDFHRCAFDDGSGGRRHDAGHGRGGGLGRSRAARVTLPARGDENGCRRQRKRERRDRCRELHEPPGRELRSQNVSPPALRSYFASGSGRSWKWIALLVFPFPPSMWNGARVLMEAQRPRPFQPALGSSIRPSSHLA